VTNWIADKNPWNLQAPPAWWLRKLHDTDAELVVLPGMTDCVYRIARKSKAARSLTPVALDSETQRFWRLGVVPVTSIVPWAQWDHSFFQWLRDHDTWAAGGGAKAADRLDAYDHERAIAQDRLLVDEADQRSASAYAAFKRRAGETVTLSQPASPLR
jgi:hypothetical protein